MSWKSDWTPLAIGAMLVAGVTTVAVTEKRGQPAEQATFSDLDELEKLGTLSMRGRDCRWVAAATDADDNEVRYNLDSDTVRYYGRGSWVRYEECTNDNTVHLVMVRDGVHAEVEVTAATYAEAGAKVLAQAKALDGVTTPLPKEAADAGKEAD